MQVRLWGVVCLLGGWAAVCGAQGNDELRQTVVKTCGVAPVVTRDSQPNIFSEQQEMWLGQVEADLVESEIRPVRDAALQQRLQRILDRMLAVMPPTTLKFQVTLVDSDDLNGFSLAGGHVYILRKLAATAKSDDELAGVMGHEMGHILSHQFAFETTREMKRLLNVTSVGGEEDIRQKYKSMLDAEYDDKHPVSNETDAEQAEADHIGIYAMSAAGYKPQSYADFWDRSFFVGGKTGSKLGDFLGMTKPSQKRLRSMDAMVAAVPANCGKGMVPDESGFAAWHDAVVANQAGAEQAHSVALSEVTLSPPLRMELSQLRFSPDGKEILAQDASSIFVLDREPLAVRFRIDAEGAREANFSPDSTRVTFTTPGLHTEEWNVAEKKLAAAHELLPREDCLDPRLSPDGRTMVCVRLNLDGGEIQIAMLDTTSSEVVWEKKNWQEEAWYLMGSFLVWESYDNTRQFFASSYSMDGNTLLFGGGGQKLAFDLRQRSVIKTGGNIRDGITGEYAFVGNDKVAGVNWFDPKNSGVFTFPEGKELNKVPIPPSTGLRPVANPGVNLHVLATGSKDFGIAIQDMTQNHYLMSLKTYGLDEYDGAVVGEAGGGAVVLGRLGASSKDQVHVDLPLSPLPYAPPAAMSKDGRYLALSASQRGGVWEVKTGKKVATLKGFTDAVWGDDGGLLLDFPKDGTVERHLARVSMEKLAETDVPFKLTDETHMRYGRLTDWKQDEKKKLWTLSMYDPATQKVTWSRVFQDRYFTYTSSFGNRDLIFNFDLSTHTAKDALKASAALTEELGAVKDKKSARLIRILDGTTGADLGELMVELPPNYAGTDGLNRAGDLLYVAGVDDRTAVYAMSSGKQVRDLIGYLINVDTDSGKIITANRVGECFVYDSTGKELAHYEMGSPIRFAKFRDGASTVTILTADEKLHTMSVSADVVK